MAKKKLILSQEQIKRICEGEDFVYLSDLASKPDMGDVYSTEITTDGSIEDAYPMPTTTDDRSHTMTNDWRGNAKLAGMGPIVVREMSKKDWAKSFIGEESEHGNERLKRRNYGADGDVKSYTATKMAVSRKNRAEDKLRNGSDEEKIKAAKTLNKMHNNWSGLDAASVQYSAAKALDKAIRGTQDGPKIASAPKEHGNGKAHTPKNGVFLN
jgi:hypothetical protein